MNGMQFTKIEFGAMNMEQQNACSRLIETDENEIEEASFWVLDGRTHSNVFVELLCYVEFLNGSRENYSEYYMIREDGDCVQVS